MSNIQEENLSLLVIGRTWEKDTNGLYDYTSKEIVEFKSYINNETSIIRKGKEILNETKEQEEEDNQENLFEIKKKENDEYIIENKVEMNMEPSEENIDKINNKLWYVIHDRNKKYCITKNDIIKLGRIKFLISEESIYSGDKKYELQIPDLNSVSKINKQNFILENPFNLIPEVKPLFDVSNNSEEKTLCKICYVDNYDPINNPMVHLCKCKGGLNYAHFNCIKHWMETKLKINENSKKTVKTYYIPKFNCEICKTPYPYKFKLNNNENKIYELINIERPKCNYIILESLNQIKENENHKFIHLIKLINENDITIGRSNLADICIHDISVSRIHAKLKFNFEQKSLEIKDLKSKFGTLVLIKDKIELKNGEGLFAQIGRSLLGVTVLKKKEEEKINENKINKDKKDNSNEEEAKLEKEIEINDENNNQDNEEDKMMENYNPYETGNEHMDIY